MWLHFKYILKSNNNLLYRITCRRKIVGEAAFIVIKRPTVCLYSNLISEQLSNNTFL